MESYLNVSKLLSSNEYLPFNKDSLMKLKAKCNYCTKSSSMEEKLILKCGCIYCPDCLKEVLVKETDGKVLLHLWESKNKRKSPENSLCSCPKHNSPIPLPLVYSLFGPKDFEEYSVQMFRRFLKKSKTN